MNKPIIHMDFLTREDESQYARIEYEGGEVEITERDDWLANGYSDFWKYGSMQEAVEAKVREYIEGKS